LVQFSHFCLIFPLWSNFPTTLVPWNRTGSLFFIPVDDVEISSLQDTTVECRGDVFGMNPFRHLFDTSTTFFLHQRADKIHLLLPPLHHIACFFSILSIFFLPQMFSHISPSDTIIYASTLRHHPSS
jgi:hypothetical protein